MPKATILKLLAVGILLSACSLKAPSAAPTSDDYIQALPKNTASEQNITTNNEPTTNMQSATIKTNLGDIVVTFYSEPTVTVANFIKLAQAGFYDGVKFHRVIKGFMVQTGDPLSRDDDWSNDGTGGPGYTFADEINNHQLVRGSLAMANAGPNTNGSQFFIVTAQATPWLDGKHTNFGYVSAGMEIIDKIEAVDTDSNDHPLTDITILNIIISQ